MAEIIHIHVGQGGIGVGTAAWELFGLEHGIQLDGQIWEEKNEDNGSLEVLFREKEDGKYIPRSLFIDLDGTTLDILELGSQKDLFDPDGIISGQEDSAGNYSRGGYSLSKEMDEKSLEKVRRLTEDGSNFQGFILTHSICGGMGSGFPSLFLEGLNGEYFHKPVITFTHYPSPNMSTTPNE